MIVEIENNKAQVSFKCGEDVTLQRLNSNEDFKKIIEDFDITEIEFDFVNCQDVDPFILGQLIIIEQAQGNKGGTLMLKNFKNTNLYKRAKDLELKFNIVG